MAFATDQPEASDGSAWTSDQAASQQASRGRLLRLRRSMCRSSTRRARDVPGAPGSAIGYGQSRCFGREHAAIPGVLPQFVMRLESAELSFGQPRDEVGPRRRGGAVRDDQAGTVAELAGQCLD